MQIVSIMLIFLIKIVENEEYKNLWKDALQVLR